MKIPSRLLCVGVLLLTVELRTAGSATGDEQQPPGNPDTLRDDQLAISGRYSRFERMLSQMADILGREDPERADLLRRAIGKGREQRIDERIEEIVRLLESREFGSAIEKQDEVCEGLRGLLTLLQSEDRRSSVEKERERLNQVLNEVRNLIAEQRSAQGAAQGATVPSNAVQPQQRAVDSSDRLLDEIRSADAERARESSSDVTPPEKNTENGDESKSSPGDNPPESSDPTENPATPDAPSPGTPPRANDQSDDPDSEPGGPKPQADSPGAPGQQSGGSTEKKQSEDRQTPGREQIESARRYMQEALEQLKEQQRDPAMQNQSKALAALHDAVTQLEEMLRQLREEEKEMILAALEARFQRMLAIQTAIHDGTVELASVPKAEWLDLYYGRSRDFSQQEAEVAQECSLTAGLLREDGTSVSILLSVEDIAADMQQIAAWLQESRVDSLVQTLQTDVIEALKELIDATQKEMQEMKSDERQQQTQDQGDQEKPPLVELIAEIKVLRSLQLRVNRRTKQVNELLLQAARDDQPALLEQVTVLADRQRRLIESARELARQAASQQPH